MFRIGDANMRGTPYEESIGRSRTGITAVVCHTTFFLLTDVLANGSLFFPKDNTLC